ncbi:unnamed protein product [Protopolystoma xenopodis]|uniref:Uncharacterized protein n=1 Tax=Protopolystoma xenopodis TaxID=117903 RepID=A0A3S5FCL4_9PLAT|nr:unnamed protein product [Protopolystoma xenopodis]
MNRPHNVYQKRVSSVGIRTQLSVSKENQGTFDVYSSVHFYWFVQKERAGQPEKGIRRSREKVPFPVGWRLGGVRFQPLPGHCVWPKAEGQKAGNRKVGLSTNDAQLARRRGVGNRASRNVGNFANGLQVGQHATGQL